MSGYFVSQGSVCLVTLVIIENSDLDRLSPTTAVRVRLMLEPFQIAGLDSDEGRSLNFMCGDRAKTLVVKYGERSKLAAQRELAAARAVADRAQQER
jgi:hypothetical protein